jgi:hypothetical protein
MAWAAKEAKLLNFYIPPTPPPHPALLYLDPPLPLSSILTLLYTTSIWWFGRSRIIFCASFTPMLSRASYTGTPSMMLSGRAKYTYLMTDHDDRQQSDEQRRKAKKAGIVVIDKRRTLCEEGRD